MQLAGKTEIVDSEASFCTAANCLLHNLLLSAYAASMPSITFGADFIYHENVCCLTIGFTVVQLQ